MVDNNENDEYEFTDLDMMNMDSDELKSGDAKTIQDSAQVNSAKNVRRNALIVVILVVLAMLAYKFMGSFFTTKNTDSSSIQSSAIPVEQPVATTTPVPVVSPPVTEQPAPTPDVAQIEQRLSVLEVGQENLRSEINSLNDQLGMVSSNINDLSNKINALNQTVSTLSAKLDEQSQKIAMMSEHARPKKVVQPRVVRKVIPQSMYYIQAVIPGRAWLISTNGSTLTVREGTPIAGYGVVKLIDPNQGRVITSSGRVIRFSQQDS